MIEIYPSKLDGLPLERHAVKARTTLRQWLVDTVRDYQDLASPPISITLNGNQVAPAAWADTAFGPDDLVHIFIEPKGGGGGFLAKIFRPGPLAKLFGLGNPFSPQSIKAPKASQTVQGAQLNESSVKANQAKLGGVIREVAGRTRIFPDYLAPVRRFFAAPREQWSEMLLCVGMGEYQIPPSSIRIGDTPLISLGDGARFRIYQPGENLTGDPSAIRWHPVSEVGPTSTGTAGMDLNTTSNVEQFANAQAYQFNGDMISIPAGAGQFPDGWAGGMLVRIQVLYAYNVQPGAGNGGRDLIAGPLEQLRPFPGMRIEIAGTNSGYYVVDSYTPGVGMSLNTLDGAPVLGLIAGGVWSCIGFIGLRYRIVSADAADIVVDRLTDTGAPDPDWPGFDPTQSNSAVLMLDGSTLEGNWCGPFAACPPNEVTGTVEIDLMFPGGLAKIADNGKLQNQQVVFEVQYRDMNAPAGWLSYSESVTDKTMDQIGLTRRLHMPYAMRPEVRMRRIGAKSTSTQVQDGVQWYALRSVLPTLAAFPGMTVMTVAVRGGNRISTQSENQISIEGTRILPVRNGAGGWGAPQPTRDIVPWFAHIARSIGYTDADLDLVEFDRLDSIWRARGDRFDLSVTDEGTVKEHLANALAVGYAEFTISRGLITPVRDEPRSAYRHLYTPQNMLKGRGLERSFQAPAPDDFDGVDVEFTDGQTWQTAVVQCRLPGDAGRKVEKVQIPGITDRTRAWRYGMRRRRAQRYRRWNYSWGTELDALNSHFWNYVAVSDDVPGYAQSAILEAITPNGATVILESSEPFDWGLAPPHLVSLRRPDGTVSGPYLATRIDDYRLTCPALDFQPVLPGDAVEPTHLLFGNPFPALVTAIEPDGFAGADVQAINYDPRVYLDDDNTPA